MSDLPPPPPPAAGPPPPPEDVPPPPSPSQALDEPAAAIETPLAAMEESPVTSEQPAAASAGTGRPPRATKPRKERTSAAERPRRVPMSRARRGVTTVGVCAVLMLASTAGGLVGGWSIANRTVVASRPNPAATVVEVPAYIGTDTVSMPDVRGLDVDDAMVVLADAGVPANIVTSSQRPSAGSKGSIVSQQPAYGTETPSKVSLVVSSGATMPALVGTVADEATDQLNELGARIERSGGYDPDEPVGTVLATSPKAGSPLDDAVTLTVNAAPSARYLALVSAVESGCSTNNSLVMDGTTYPQGLVCSTGSADSPYQASWLLEKAVDRITGEVGVPDTADVGSTVHVRILGDSEVLFDDVVRYGAPQKLDLRSTGVLRLTIRSWTTGESSASLGLGDLQLSGASTAMARLEQ